MKTETRHLAAALYRLAHEIRTEEGCVTAAPGTVDDAALRLDDQTIAISYLKRVQADLVLALERQIANIEHWLETDIPATPEESRSIYEQMKSAVALAYEFKTASESA